MCHVDLITISRNETFHYYYTYTLYIYSEINIITLEMIMIIARLRATSLYFEFVVFYSVVNIFGFVCLIFTDERFTIQVK